MGHDRLLENTIFVEFSVQARFTDLKYGNVSNKSVTVTVICVLSNPLAFPSQFSFCGGHLMHSNWAVIIGL
jgi:hypothetical protein